MPSTPGNSTDNSIPAILLTSFNSLPLEFIHSPDFYDGARGFLAAIMWVSIVAMQWRVGDRHKSQYLWRGDFRDHELQHGNDLQSRRVRRKFSGRTIPLAMNCWKMWMVLSFADGDVVVCKAKHIIDWEARIALAGQALIHAARGYATISMFVRGWVISPAAGNRCAASWR